MRGKKCICARSDAGLHRRAGLSVVFVVIAFVALVAFVSLAVDVGRARLARSQHQNAADAAALAAAHLLAYLPESDGIERVEDAAWEAAAQNFNLDQSNGSGGRSNPAVELVVEEDVEFGIWRDSDRTFTLLESVGGGVDERRMANAVRVWSRRVTTFDKHHYDGSTSQIRRDTGLPLIFAPILGIYTGEIQQQATVRLKGGRQGHAGFVGLQWVKFNGISGTDSYNAATETYPGADGVPNQNGTVASNGTIELVGNAHIQGDVHPGVDSSIIPIPLGGNVRVTGYMDPLEEPLVYNMPPFDPPPLNQLNPPISGRIVEATDLNVGTLAFRSSGKTTIYDGQYYFSSWTSGSHDLVELDNRQGPITIWINGNLKNGAQARVRILSDEHPVTFHVNGNFDMQGGGIANETTNPPTYVAKPENLIINVTKTGTSVDIGGSPTTSAHIYAPGSDVKIHGNANGNYGFWGWIVGKSLFVAGGSHLHYDETLGGTDVAYSIHLVD